MPARNDLDMVGKLEARMRGRLSAEPAIADAKRDARRRDRFANEAAHDSFQAEEPTR